MLYQITHQTKYEYSTSVTMCQNLAHLTPRETAQQHCRQTALLIHPQPAVQSSRLDYFGNQLTFFAVQESHRTLNISATHEIDVFPRAVIDPQQTLAWDAARDRLRTSRDAASLDAYQFTFASRHVPFSRELADYARPLFANGRPLIEAVLELTEKIHREFQYDPASTTIATPIEEVFAQRRGVCQDFSHLQIACLRSLGIAARYVSGYLRTTPVPGKPRLIGADATHAWVSVYGPDVGWVDFDPTNNVQPYDKHLVLGWGRDFDDVSPLKGVILGGEQHSVHVSVDVREAGEV